jgi:hypothetical protein
VQMRWFRRAYIHSSCTAASFPDIFAYCHSSSISTSSSASLSAKHGSALWILKVAAKRVPIRIQGVAVRKLVGHSWDAEIQRYQDWVQILHREQLVFLWDDDGYLSIHRVATRGDSSRSESEASIFYLP